ncbi:MAG: hypothetical protein K8T20_19835 [Planctomycetes bacterium]|nr:hypothetical protein [Planctomycetota bacterium]
MERNSEAPRGTVTIAFLDAPGAAPGDHGEFDRIVREAVGRSGGFEVKSRGGSLMVAFGAAGDAVRGVLEAQAGLVAAGAPLARVGLHTGEPLRTDDGGVIDYLGLDVNRAARIAAAGHAGQVLMSEASRGALDAAPAGSELRDLGEHRLRGFERPERVWLALPPALRGREFPPLTTPPARPTNLPPATSAFVGRERELETIAGFLAAPGTRIVTLLGPGGVGKTRLAVRAAAAALDGFPGGAWFADLTVAEGAAGIAHAVAKALGVELPPRENPLAAVASMLELRSPVLVVLDNFEQLVEYAAATAGAWAAGVAGAKFIVTSRALLRVPGESMLDVEPLPAPPAGFGGTDPEALLKWDSARLFVERAAVAKAGFHATAENAAEIAEICTRLDGMPLAIELAAARVTVLRPADIVARLDRKYDLLKSSQRDLSPRQRTLLGAIEWSFDLLGEIEREAFLQCCIFRGGFTAEAAGAVLQLAGDPPAAEILASLRDKSLLRAHDGPLGVRFSMYVSLHEYAWHRWRWTADEARQRGLAERHARFFAARAMELGDRLRREGGGVSADLLELDSENVFAAHDFALECGDGALASRLMIGIDPKLDLRGPTDERLKRLDATLATLGTVGPPELRVPLLCSYMLACVQSGIPGRPSELVEEAVALARASGRPDLIAHAVARRAALAMQRSAGSPANADLAEAESICRALGDEAGLGRAIGTRGVALRSEGRLDEAEAAFEESGELFRRIGNMLGLSQSIGHRAQLLCDRGHYADALDGFRQAEALALEAGSLRNAANWRWRTADALALTGRPEEAAAALSEADDLVRAVGDRRLLARTMHLRAEILLDLGDAAGAIRVFDEALIHRRTTSDPRGAGNTLTRRGRARSVVGDEEGARADLRDARAMFEGIRDNYSIGSVELECAIVDRRAGKAAAGLIHLEQAEGLLQGEMGQTYLPELRAERARLLVKLGRGPEAHAAAVEAEAAARRMSMDQSRAMINVLSARAESARAAGLVDDAAARGLALAASLNVALSTLPVETREALTA